MAPRRRENQLARGKKTNGCFIIIREKKMIKDKKQGIMMFFRSENIPEECYSNIPDTLTCMIYSLCI